MNIDEDTLREKIVRYGALLYERRLAHGSAPATFPSASTTARSS